MHNEAEITAGTCVKKVSGSFGPQGFVTLIDAAEKAL